jgi:hypothetical protein
MITVVLIFQVYDMIESQVKINDVIEFIGVYTFDPELAAPNDNQDDIMFDLIEDVTAQLPPSKVCPCIVPDLMYNSEKGFVVCPSVFVP